MNQTLIQYFEWYLPSDGAHWRRTAGDAQHLAQLGFTGVWLPPAYKGAKGGADTGYAVYDLYDLGEFDQKGSVPTKYGTRDEYLAAIAALHQAGLAVYPDIVLNHRIGADETERVTVRRSDEADRTREIGGEEQIDAWTRFTFPGRGGKYSTFQWNWTHFNAVDWDNGGQRSAIFRFEGKPWERDVDKERGNFDYLMGANLDTKNPQVVDELDAFGAWYLQTTGADGFRLDAVKHIRFDFFTHWLERLRSLSGRPLFAVGEYWNGEVGMLTHYLDACGRVMQLFDVPLHYNFYRASTSGGNFDMRRIFEGTLTAARPARAVTFVDNHDTQCGQALHSPVQSWFKPLCYALILLREAGLPCVFYGDYYGTGDGAQPPLQGVLDVLLRARKYCAYGEQTDYFDDYNIVGWTRAGDAAHPGSGLAAVLSDGPGGEKEMCMGVAFAGRRFYDALGGCPGRVTVGENGCARFPVSGGAVALWLPEDGALGPMGGQ